MAAVHNLTGPLRTCALLASGLFSTALAQSADIAYVEAYFNVNRMQTNDLGALTDNGAFFATAAITTNSGVYTGGSLLAPGLNSPVALTATSSTRIGYVSPTFANQAAMQAAFAQGVYQYSLASAGPPALASFTLGAAHYTNSLPSLTGTSYTRLQGMNPALPITLGFSTFATDPAATESFQHFTVYDYTLGQFVFQATLLPAANTAVTLPAQTLALGHLYAYELNFDSRLLVAAPGTNQGAQVGFDVRTSGNFATAVPEPSSALMWIAGVAVLLYRRAARPTGASHRREKHWRSCGAWGAGPTLQKRGDVTQRGKKGDAVGHGPSPVRQ